MFKCWLNLAIAVLVLGGVSVRGALIGEWRFDDGSGSSATDSSANSNNGTLTNMDTGSCWIDGVYRGALEFDGTNDYVSLGSPSDLDNLFSSDVTMTAWVYIPESHGNITLISAYPGSYSYGFHWRVGHDNRVDAGAVFSTTNCARGWTTDTVDEGWNFLALVYDNTTKKITLYKNGFVLSGGNDTAGSGSYTDDSAGNKVIGQWFTTTTLWNWEGVVDNFRIYDSALSAREVLLLAYESDYRAHWRFDDASGTTAVDSTMYGNDGTLTLMGATPWITGKMNGALDFTSSADYVNVPNDPALQLSGDLTISMWINPTNVGVQRGNLIHKSYGGEFSVVLESDGSVRLYHGKSTTSGCYVSMLPIPANTIVNNEWQHLVLTRNVSTLQVKGYVNGELVDTVSWSDNSNYSPPATSTSPVVIGDGYTYDMNGSIDEVILADRVMSADEITGLYQAADLRGSWNMDEGQGTTTADMSDYGNHASFVSMAASPWVTGHINPDGYFRNALSFDNTDDYLSVSNHSSLQITGDLTISLWIKPTTIGVQRCSLVHKNIKGEYSLTLEEDGSVRLWQGRTDNNSYWGGELLPENSIVNDEWQHLAVTRNITTRQIRGYVDGVLKGTTIIPDNSNYYPPQTSTNAVMIGDGFTYDFNGDIDKLKIYSRVLSNDEIEGMQSNLLEAYPNKTYYTTEDATAVCILDMPSAELNGCKLVAMKGITTLGTNTTPENGTDITCTNSLLSSGANEVTVELQRDTGELVFDYDIEMVKKSSNTGFETKVDRQNGIVVRDGTGFFPVGIYMYNMASSDTTDFQAVSGIGFDSIVRWNSNVSPSDSTTYLENADNYNLLVIDKHESYSTVNLTNLKLGTSEDFWDAYKGLGDSPYDVDQSVRMIQAVGYADDESNLIGYYTFDEPMSSQINAGQDLYDRTNTEDGYHPTFAVYSSGAPEGDNYTNWCDIYGVDLYWTPPRVSGDLSTSVDWVTKRLCQAKARADYDHKALWAVLMSEYYSGCHKRAMTEDEQRCQTYLALIHGAKGIFYFKYPIYHEDHWDNYEYLAGELADLAPIMLEPDLEQAITYSDGPFDPASNNFVDIQVCLRQAPSSANYDYVLLATNTREYSVDVDYTISLLGSSGTVSRLFDTSTYSVSNGEFSDTLAAFATRAYTFCSTSTDPVSIDVDITPGTPPAAETVHPVSGREGCTNLMQNPSLEDATVTKWPDYCFPYLASPRINTANQGWGLDTSGAYHSNSCLKIKRDIGLNGFLFTLVPEHSDPNGKDYTFSVYLKADQNNVQVRIGCTSEGYVTETLTTSWARYDYTVNLPDDLIDNQFYVLLMTENRTIWVDAVQVEQASSASTFTTD